MLPPPYADADRPARRPVWEALSTFWLDAEMTAIGAYYVVRTVLESPYTVAEAEAIHWHEVAPAVYGTALSVAGEWAAFDEGWLAERCDRRARQRRPGWRRAGRTRALRALAGPLPDLVFDRARRAERDGLPPAPTGPPVSLLVSGDPLVLRRPLRYRVPW